MRNHFDNAKFRELLRAYPVKAIELLYKRYYDSLFRIARFLTRNDEASKDIVQETLATVWENRRQLGREDDRSIEHYLVKVAKYKAITCYKEARTFRTTLSSLDGYQTVDESSIEEEMIRNEFLTQMRGTISGFPKRERECLELKIDDDLSNSEIAKKLGVTKKAVERTLTSAYKRLRTYWAENGRFS